MITNAGNAYFRGRVEGGTALFSGTLYMALSTDTTPPAATDTTVPGEQTTNGLQRAAVTASHATGSNVWAYTNSFTYSGTAAVTVSKVCLYDAPSAGNLIEELLVSPTTFQNAGDNGSFQVTFTV